MPNLLDAVYALALVGATPWFAWQRWRYGKRRSGWWQKLTGLLPARPKCQPCAWFHAVSVGEVLLLRPLIGQIRRQFSNWQLYLTTGTSSGLDVARRYFPDLLSAFAPFDFSWAIEHALDRIQPDLILLTELELWPNWLTQALRRRIPVVVINGRISSRSFRGYRLLGRAFPRYTAAVQLWAMQNQTYAERLRQLHVPESRIAITGSMKFDGVPTERFSPQTRFLAHILGLRQPDDPTKTDLVWVAGSTQDPEEKIVLEIYRRLFTQFPQLRLILVPRHRERFDEVAKLIEASGWRVVRRSTLPDYPNPSRTGQPNSAGQTTTEPPAVILVDTLGELAHVWGLADIAFVGGSFGNRGGQNMLEPAALGLPVLFGPHVWNFQEIADRLCQARAAIQVQTPQALETALLHLLTHPPHRRDMGERARQFVLSQQGAVSRTLAALQPFLTAPITHPRPLKNTRLVAI